MLKERGEAVGLFRGWLRFQEGSGIAGFLNRDEGVALVSKKKRVKKGETLEDILTEMGECERCGLYKKRTMLVFGSGSPKAELMFIGEAPGRDEDIQGKPFVGRAGQLLTKIIEAMGMKRADVYITNIVKSRPPENRVPTEEEVAKCITFLYRQIDAINPKVIVTLGSTAALSLLNLHGEAKIGDLRGKWQDLKGTPVMPTYHPAFLLRNPDMKRVVWGDMKRVVAKLKEIPAFAGMTKKDKK